MSKDGDYESFYLTYLPLKKKLFQSPIVIIIASLDQDTIVLFSV